jgi:hypothetical protein
VRGHSSASPAPEMAFELKVYSDSTTLEMTKAKSMLDAIAMKATTVVIHDVKHPPEALLAMKLWCDLKKDY